MEPCDTCVCGYSSSSAYQRLKHTRTCRLIRIDTHSGSKGYRVTKGQLREALNLMNTQLDDSAICPSCHTDLTTMGVELRYSHIMGCLNKTFAR